MEIKLKELIDINQLQSLQDRLNNMYSFPSAIIDNEGNILTSVGWQDICANFHRKYPESAKECTKSDIYILQHLNEANPAVSYICPHGLIDSATPIIIDGIHLGNFFTGQFFLNEKPDIEFFRSQAKKFGYNEKEYLEAVENVPIWSKEKLDQYIEFIKRFIVIIAEIGLKNLREIETNRLLKESEERFKSIVECTSDWYWEINNNGEYSYCSENVEKILGYTPKELIGKTPYHIMPTEEKERVKKYFQKVLNDKSPIVEFENWNLRKDGSLVCLMTNGIPVFNKEGNLTGYKGADKDITEKKKAEQLIKSEKQRLTYILEGTNVGTWEWNILTGETVFNERWADIIGYTLDELSPLSIETWTKFIHPEDQKKSSELLEKHFKGELDYYEVEVRMRHKNDSWIWILDRGKVYEWDDSGNPVKMAGTHQEITERKKSEEALIKALKLAEENQIKYKNLIDHSINITYLYSNIKGGLFWSKQIEKILEFEQDDLIKDPFLWNRSIHNDDKPLVQKAIEDYLIGADYKIEYRIKTKSGKWKWFLDYFISKTIIDKEIIIEGQATDITERKEAEITLQKSEKQFKDYIDYAPHGVFVTNENGDYIDVNPTACKLTGYTREELLSMNLIELIPSDNLEIAKNHFSRVVMDGYAHGETKFMRKDGTIGYWTIEAIKMSDIRFLGFAIDITERKLSEEEIVKSESKFRHIAENTSDGILVIGADSKIKYASPAYTKQLGYTEEEILSRDSNSIYNLVHPDDRDELFSNILSSINSKQEHLTYSYRVRNKSGNYIYREDNAKFNYDNDHNFKDTIVICRDVSERKRSEEALRESEARLELFFAQSLDGFFFMTIDEPVIWDDSVDKIKVLDYVFAHQRITKVNEALLAQYGTTKEDFLGLTPNDLFKHNIEYGKGVWRDFFDKGTLHIVTDERKIDGTPIWIEGDYICLYDNNRRITGHFGIQRDITDRKKTEEELEKHRNNLEELIRIRTEELERANKSLKEVVDKEKELNEMKSRFISTTSHEFRTPLTSVLSSTQLLQKFGVNWSEEKKNEHYNRIVTSIEYITNLLDDILTLNRAESGKISYNPEIIDLKVFAEKCLLDAKTLITEKHELMFNYKLRQKEFWLDSKLMKFIFNNLLSNAAKYSPDGGKIELVISKDKKTLVIEVSDEGIGIPSEDLDKIFDSFYRTKNGEDISGTGLGLSIVKRSVDLHKGEIKVESELDKGTKFTVLIPIISNT